MVSYMESKARQKKTMPQTHRYRDQVDGCQRQGWEMGEMGGQKVQALL